MKLILALILTLAASVGARAAEITLGASGPMRAALSLLVPQFEKATGHRVHVLYASDVEARAATARGEDVDVAIIAEPFDAVVAGGNVVVDSYYELARVRVGLAVRGRDPKPNIETAENLRRVLLAAPRIAYPDPAGSAAGAIFEKVLSWLGVASELAPKLRKVRGGPAAMVALPREEADIGVAFVSEILPEPGVEIIGSITDQFDAEALFAGFVLKGSKQPEAATALLDFLGAADRGVYATAGMFKVRDFWPGARGPRQ